MNAALEVNSLLMMDDVNKFLYERLKGDIDRVERLNDFENALLRKMKGMTMYLFTHTYCRHMFCLR